VRIASDDEGALGCPGGFAVSAVSGEGPLSVLVPRSRFLNHVPEMQIRPGCKYRVQVHANPRARPAGKLPEVSSGPTGAPEAPGTLRSARE